MSIRAAFRHTHPITTRLGTGRERWNQGCWAEVWLSTSSVMARAPGHGLLSLDLEIVGAGTGAATDADRAGRQSVVGGGRHHVAVQSQLQ